MSHNKKIDSMTVFSWGVVVVLIVALVWWMVQSQKSQEASTTYDIFAQCLAAKNLTMYGAEWCPHCKEEKKRFGASFQYVPYVECPQNIALCTAKGIQGYPTWITASGTKYEGEQGLEKLSQISGCPLPGATTATTTVSSSTIVTN